MMAGSAAQPRWWVEALGVLGAIAIILFAWRAVVFDGKTLDGSGVIAGVNGSALPSNVQPTGNPYLYRIDLGSSSWATMPWAEVTNRDLKEPTVPLWNPYAGAGTPLAANMQSAVFDPLLLGVNLHPTPRMWDLTFICTFILGSLATYLFVRLLGMGVTAALTGAAGFSLCGYFVINNNNSFVRAYVYIPLLVLAIELVARSEKLRWVALLGVVVAGSLLAGMPEAAFFSLILAGIYAFYRIAVSHAGTRIFLFLRYGSSALLGLALAAPLLVLFLQYLPLSFNVHEPGVGLSAVSRVTVLNWLFPLLNGYPASRYSGLSADRSWSGTAVIVLALIAVSAPAVRRFREAWLFLLLALVVILKMHGFPGVQWLGRLPVADRAVWDAFAPPVASFCLAVVAAIGVDAIANGRFRRIRLIVAVGVVSVLLRILYVSERSILRTAPEGAVRHSLFIGFAACLLVTAVAFLAASIPRFRRFAALIAALTVIGELSMFMPNDTYSKRADPYLAPDWTVLLAQAQPTDRVFAFDGVLYPNTAGALGIQDVRTLDALYINRYLTYIRTFVSPTFTDRFTGEGMNSEEILANRMFDLLGVRYVLANENRPPVSTSAGDGLTLLGTKGSVSVYLNEHAIPRVFVANEVFPVAGIKDAIAFLQSFGHPTSTRTSRIDRFDPFRQAVVETDGAPLLDSMRNAEIATATPRPAKIVSYASSRVEVWVPAGAPGLLVLTDTFYPGWDATVNGTSSAIFPTDVAFRGVALGPEESTVVFSYQPRTAVLGWGIAALAVLTIFSFALFLRYRRGRQSRSHAY
jgi:hypothetical protein